MITFAIVGALGRMGQTIARLSLADEQLQLAKTFEHSGHQALGKPYSEVAGLAEVEMKLETISAQALGSIQGVIDFSAPESSVQTVELCVKENVALVIGTTGWSSEQLTKVKTASKNIPILLASNMSLGVNLLFALTKAAAKALKNHDFDAEIVEFHHRLKKDSPSGTATTLKEILLTELGRQESDVTYGRSGMVGERPEKEVGVMAIRGGDMVGEHSVYFFGNGERISLNHQATSRDTFAQGALFALKFLQSQGKGMYNMQDALNLYF